MLFQAKDGDMTHIPDRRITDEAAMKKVMKQAIKEWMDEKFTTFGKWSAATIAILALGALAYFIVQMNGFNK